MLIYKANRTNFSFYQKDETHTKEEWKKQLNINEDQFAAIAISDFTEIDSEELIFEVMKAPPLLLNQIVIRKDSDSSGLSADEVRRLSPLLELLLKDFNINNSNVQE